MYEGSLNMTGFKDYEEVGIDSQSSAFEFDDPDLEASDQTIIEKPDLDCLRVYFSEIAKIPIMDPVEVHQLAQLIQEGKNAENILATLEFAEIPFEDEVRQIVAKAEAGKIAQERLFRGHLRFAAYAARASMGWRQEATTAGYIYSDEDLEEEPKNKRKAKFKKTRSGLAGRGPLSRFQGYPLPLEDRVQAANIGLWRAVQKYKPALGASFITYALYDIEHAIERAAKMDRVIHTPLHILECLHKVQADPTALKSQKLPYIDVLGRSQNPEAWKKFLEELRGTIPLEEVGRTDFLSTQAMALEISKDDEPLPEFIETVKEDVTSPTVEEEAEDVITHQSIQRALEALPRREREILKMRFGFYGDPWTLEEIARHPDINLTRERVRQLEGQALSRLASLREMALLR